MCCEWRVRFDPSNPAQATHTHHPPSSELDVLRDSVSWNKFPVRRFLFLFCRVGGFSRSLVPAIWGWLFFFLRACWLLGMRHSSGMSPLPHSGSLLPPLRRPFSHALASWHAAGVAGECCIHWCSRLLVAWYRFLNAGFRLQATRACFLQSHFMCWQLQKNRQFYAPGLHASSVCQHFLPFHDKFATFRFLALTMRASGTMWEYDDCCLVRMLVAFWTWWVSSGFKQALSVLIPDLDILMQVIGWGDFHCKLWKFSRYQFWAPDAARLWDVLLLPGSCLAPRHACWSCQILMVLCFRKQPHSKAVPMFATAFFPFSADSGMDERSSTSSRCHERGLLDLTPYAPCYRPGFLLRWAQVACSWSRAVQATWSGAMRSMANLGSGAVDIAEVAERDMAMAGRLGML